MSNNEEIKRFGEKLRYLRQREGLSQEQLGNMLDVHQTHVGRIERGAKMPNAAMILKISRLFRVSADVLIKDELDL
ncbi:helix-turn-helix transcriptional regulator [Anaerolineales bacterium HSG6]|nr:helix-turn-helix transcriptional regulator [Anaerolineales bacterium HSG6]MDM8531283.1 helix-turn-helix transcriptional regulator [Anaerolineales bacterium HSG25]